MPTKCYAAHHPGEARRLLMVRCHLSKLMGQRKLRVADVARLTGLNRSTLTALCQQRATRVDLPSLDRLCTFLHCQVSDLLEHVADDVGSAT